MQRGRPQESKRPPSGLLWLIGVLAALAAAGIWIRAAVEAQRPQGSDEDQIRRMLYEAEKAAERRSPAGVSHFISNDYDDGTLRAAQVRYEITRYLQSEQSLETTIPSESVQPVIDPGGQTGTVNFRMSVAHRDRNGAASSDLQMSLKLKKDRVYYFWLFPGEEWRVSGAGGWEPLGDGF